MLIDKSRKGPVIFISLIKKYVINVSLRFNQRCYIIMRDEKQFVFWRDYCHFQGMLVSER